MLCSSDDCDRGEPQNIVLPLSILFNPTTHTSSGYEHRTQNTIVLSCITSQLYPDKGDHVWALHIIGRVIYF